MNQSNKLWVMKFFAYAPICFLFALFALFYICYMQLLTGTYDLDADQPPSVVGAPTAFIAMKTMTSFMSSLVEKTFDTSDMQEKGIVYVILFHIFIAFFLISALRVIFTDPGKVSDDWNTRTEQELNKAIETEKRILRNIRLRAKRQQIRQNTASRILRDLSNGIIEDGKDTQTDQPTSPFPGNDKGSFQQSEDLKFGDEGNGGERLSQEVQGQGGPEETDDYLFEGEEELRDDNWNEREQEHMLNLEGLNIKTDDLTQEKIHQYAVMTALKRGNRRFCAHCQKFKPERAHHCRQCGTCVLKMDHHCPWVNNCVGFFNYKYFLNMLFWADMSLLFISVTFTEVIQDSLFNYKVGWVRLYFYLVIYLIGIALTAILLLFFSFHLWLIASGKSTLEFCEKKNESSYSKGVVKNFFQILGSNVLIWCIPICNYQL